MGKTPKIQIINEYIEKVMPEIKNMADSVEDTKVDWDSLNELFMRMVRKQSRD